MRIAVDAMGSDHFPKPDVEGAIQAAREWGDTILLVGDETIIKHELDQYPLQGLSIEVIHTPDYVRMDDLPSQVGRTKPRSSMHIASQLVKDKQADALVTAGNTGAALAITTLYTIKRIRGVKRPTLAAIVPLPHIQKKFIMSDIGANTDCRPEWLIQFATMTSLYAEKNLGIKNPRIGLLSNGEEESKGNAQIRETHELLKASALNYVGNVEPKEILNGAIDVMVSDGLVGNVFMKTIEAVLQTMQTNIRQELYTTWRSKLGGWLARPAFRRLGKKFDPFEIGGTLLLGVNGVVIITHGRTNTLGIKNSIRMAREAAAQNLIGAFQEAMQGQDED